MAVNFDLYKTMRARDKQQENVQKVPLYCVALFFVLCAVFIACSSIKIYSQNKELAAVRAQKSEYEAKLVIHEKNILRFSKYAENANANMAFVLESAPVIEFLSDLSSESRDDISVESAEISDGNAKISGCAYTDQDILEFCEELQKTASVQSVLPPDISTDNDTRMHRFTAEIKLKPLIAVIDREAK